MIGSIAGVSISVLVIGWQYQDVFRVLFPTLSVMLGVGGAAVLLIQLVDHLDRKTLSLPTASTAILSASLQPHPIREAANKPQRLQRPSPQAKPKHQSSLNPIVERKLEDEYDYWWYELDSKTQNYAMILGYTQYTWDNDYELEDLPCEDWYWDEMTEEEKAAAQHFGYSKDEWDVE